MDFFKLAEDQIRTAATHVNTGIELGRREASQDLRAILHAYKVCVENEIRVPTMLVAAIESAKRRLA